MVGTRPRDAHRTRAPGMIDTTAADQVSPGVTASFRTYIGTLLWRWQLLAAAGESGDAHARELSQPSRAPGCRRPYRTAGLWR